MARVSVRKVQSRDGNLEDLLRELTGGTPATEHTNIAALMRVRKMVHAAALDFVAETVRLSREMPEFVSEAARLRVMFQQMFTNMDFLSEETLTGDRATEFKQNYLETKKHELSQTILLYTSKLTKLDVMPPGKLEPEALEAQNRRLLARPVDLLGQSDIFGYASGTDASAPRFLALCTWLPRLAQKGIEFYHATLEPEVDLDRLLDILTEIIPSLARNTRSCKKAIGAISRAKDILRTNIRKYMKKVTLLNSPVALFEGLIEDIKDDALNSDETDHKATARELAVLLRELRKRFNLHNAPSGSPAGRIAMVVDMADEYLEKLERINDGPTTEEHEARIRESFTSLGSLSDALSNI